MPDHSGQHRDTYSVVREAVQLRRGWHAAILFSIIGMLYGRVLKIEPGKEGWNIAQRWEVERCKCLWWAWYCADAQRTQKSVQLREVPVSVLLAWKADFMEVFQAPM